MTETVGNEMQQPARSWLGMLGRRWPTALGLAVAASSAYELVGGTTAEGVEQALIIALPVLVYLTAAVLDRPRSAWPVTVATCVLVFGMSAFDIELVLGLAAASGVVLVVGISGPADGQEPCDDTASGLARPLLNNSKQRKRSRPDTDRQQYLRGVATGRPVATVCLPRGCSRPRRYQHGL
jgi:hypothetical protein